MVGELMALLFGHSICVSCRYYAMSRRTNDHLAFNLFLKRYIFSGSLGDMLLLGPRQ